MNKKIVLFLLLSFLVFAGCSNNQVEEEVLIETVDQYEEIKLSSTFFLTSVGSTDGANLGGIEGADSHCRALAEAAGIIDKTWRAYLSTTSEDARDRIGEGPWYNVLGVEVASSIENLHGENGLTKESVVNEYGNIVNGRGDAPNRHDILTGSNLDGTLYIEEGVEDSTCLDWTSNRDATGSARVGHHDRIGGGDHPESWNSAHNSRGCSQENLESTGGDGLFYCFAIE